MTRRARRRIAVIGTSAMVGAAAPVWGPPLLRALPAFRVERVEVVGGRFVTEGEVIRLADVPPGASVWDDPAPWEAAVRRHPLVREARVRRAGRRRLEIRIREAEPVALVATPRLVAVDVEGRVLPLPPARHALDLPILDFGPASVPSGAGLGAVAGGRLDGEEARSLLGLLARLDEHDPALVARVSELRLAPGPSLELRLLEGSPPVRILLPAGRPIEALRRVEAALADAAGRGVVTAEADARFRGQVVLKSKEDA